MAKKTVTFNVIWLRNCRPVTLTEGAHPLVLSMSRPTEEGWEYEEHSFMYESGVIYRESASGGCDCDGRIDHYQSDCCPDTEVFGRLSPNKKNILPAWRDVKRSQRDQYAEMMGY